MSNAEKLRNLTFKGNNSITFTYNYVPTSVQRKSNRSIPTDVTFRCATSEDIETCASFINKYNTKFSIEYDESLKSDIIEIIENEGIFILIESAKGLIGMFYILVSECTAPVKNYKIDKLVKISNIILAKQHIDNISVYKDTLKYAVSLVANWGIFDSTFIVDISLFMSSYSAYRTWRYLSDCANTLFIGESADGFNSVIMLIGTERTKNGSLVVKDIYEEDVGKICESCSSSIRNTFEEVNNSIYVDSDFCEENLFYFTCGFHLKERTVDLLLDSLICDNKSAQLYDRSLVEEKRRETGSYFPLVISTSCEVILNHTTYWILKEKGVSYVTCIIQ